MQTTHTTCKAESRRDQKQKNSLLTNHTAFLLTMLSFNMIHQLNSTFKLCTAVRTRFLGGRMPLMFLSMGNEHVDICKLLLADRTTFPAICLVLWFLRRRNWVSNCEAKSMHTVPTSVWRLMVTAVTPTRLTAMTGKAKRPGIYNADEAEKRSSHTLWDTTGTLWHSIK